MPLLWSLNINNMTLYEIELALAHYFNPRINIIVPNVYWGMGLRHECDLLVLRKTGYCAEIEIKRSRADCRADLNKKHGHASDLIRELWFAMPMDIYESCLDLVPERAGILTIERTEYGTGYRVDVRRGAKRNMKARRLTDQERMNLARLGCMRIWGLKRKLVTK